MTEKRFEEYDNGFEDKIENEYFETNKEIVDRLNELSEENEQLKSDLDYFKAKNGSLETGMFNFERENKQLKQLIKKVLETTPIKHSLAIDLKNSIRELYE